MRLAPEDEPLLVGVATAQRERARTFKEMAQNSEFFFRDFDSYDEKAASRNLTITTLPYLTALYDALESLADWNASSINERINSVASANGVGLGKVAQPLRVAVTGGAVSPPIDVTVALLGRHKTLMRLSRARSYASSRAAVDRAAGSA